MNTREKLMYQIISNISSTNAPIVFKGALITNLILQENNYQKIVRATKDIDANWVGNPPTIDILVDTINQSLGELSDQFVAIPTRESGDMKAAGVSIVERETSDEVISMDIDIKPVTGIKVYYNGNAIIKGVLPNEILVDKISACSTDVVYKWRTKDIVDVYALSHCVRIDIKEIFEISKQLNRKIGSFDAFYNKKSELQYSYEKLRGIEGKPNFDSIYNYLSIFFEPFAQRELKSKIWNNKKLSWNEPEALIQKRKTKQLER